MFTEHYTPLKNDVTNQYIYMDNNLVFLRPRVLNTQKMPRRPDITLRENIIEKIRLRGQQVAFTKINVIRVDTGGENSGTDKKWINEQLKRISSGDNLEIILTRIDTRDVKVNTLLLWKESIKRILKQKMEDKKKLIIFKIIHFKAYRPVAVINNDSEEDV